MTTINREVGEQGKGFRLQRLRAIKLLFEKMNASRKAVIYAGTEFFDDVYIKTIEGDKVEVIAEGDKNIDSKPSFSFMSNEVKNSLISFLDCWFQYDIEGLTFCFYTNVRVGKEYNTHYTKSHNVYCKIEVQSFARGKCRVLHYFNGQIKKDLPVTPSPSTVIGVEST